MVRLANIVPVIFRKELKDIQINGYTIPTGWAVVVSPPTVHLNPKIYKDPLTFNPWRWKRDKTDAWIALWTVCLHNIFTAIAMGIALLRMIPDCPLLSCVAYAFAFAISSPIAVAIGMVIDATTHGCVADWIYAISMGIACGVFIYVAINHHLAKGLHSAEAHHGSF